MLDGLSLKARVLIQVVGALLLQVCVVVGVLAQWEPATLITVSLVLGLGLLWLYLNSAAVSRQFVDTLVSAARRAPHVGRRPDPRH